MTKGKIIKEIERHMDITGAMVRIESPGITVREYSYAVYGIKRFNGMTYFVRDFGKDNLVCPAKWGRFRKDDLQEIYERIKNNSPKIYSRKDGDGYDFYKIWL